MKKEVKFDIKDRTFDFAVRVVRLCRELDQQPGVSRTLAKQLLRSATSIGANLEEGQAGQSVADYLSKYSIACKEARETHYWLRIFVASGILSQDRLSELIDEANQIIAILTTIVKKTKADTKT